MLEYLMVLGHQQVQCSLQNHTYFFMLWSFTGYHWATTAVTLCSVGTQSKLHKDKVQNKSQMDGTEQCWGRDKMAAIFQKTFSNTFSWMKMYEFQSKFHWSLFLGVKLTILQHWFRLWLGANQATSHYLNQLERLRSEDTPRRLMITHTIESYWIPSQKKTKSKLQI